MVKLSSSDIFEAIQRRPSSSINTPSILFLLLTTHKNISLHITTHVKKDREMEIIVRFFIIAIVMVLLYVFCSLIFSLWGFPISSSCIEEAQEKWVRWSISKFSLRKYQ
ncbi:hypothetical protein COP1_042023 [Malus domestica]